MAWVAQEPLRRLAAGDRLLGQGLRSRCLYVLMEGEVEIWKNGVLLDRVSEPGSLFGELAVLLGTFHNATVRAVGDCSFRMIRDPMEFLKENPLLTLHMAQMLARRLSLMDSRLADPGRAGCLEPAGAGEEDGRLGLVRQVPLLLN